MSMEKPMEKSNTFSKKIAIIMDLVIVAFLIAADQFIKYVVVNKLKGNDAYVLIKDVLEFDYLENRGSAFGMLQNQKIFILLVGFVFMAIIVFLIFKLPNKKRFVPAHIFFALVVAGGIGNMIDRFRTNYVVDFIYFKLINFPIFNVADIYVTVSTFLLLILFLFYYKENDFAFLSFKQQKKFREFK